MCVYRVPHESHGVGVGVGEVFVDGCECRGDKGFRYDQTGHMAISTEQAPIYPLVCPLPPPLAQPHSSRPPTLHHTSTDAIPLCLDRHEGLLKGGEVGPHARMVEPERVLGDG